MSHTVCMLLSFCDKNARRWWCCYYVRAERVWCVIRCSLLSACPPRDEKEVKSKSKYWGGHAQRKRWEKKRVSQQKTPQKLMRHVWVFFSPEKIFNLRREKSRGCFVSSILVQKEYLETRTQRAPHGHLSAPLKTDCNPTSVPRRQGIPELLRVCPPGRNPGGNTRRSGVHRVRLELFFFLFVLVFYYPAPFFFFGRSWKFFGEKTHVALFSWTPVEISHKNSKNHLKKRRTKISKKKNAFFSLLFCTKTHTRNP